MTVKPDQPFLGIQFTYDHASGLFTAHMANGASFTLDKANVSGRLQNALTLFARGVVAAEGGKWAKPIKNVGEVREHQYDETQVKRYSTRGRRVLPELNLDDLQLDLQIDLET